MATRVNLGARDKKVEAITGARTLRAAESGTEFVLDATAGATVTLPSLANGLVFKFVLGAVPSSGNWVIDSAEGDNVNGIIADLGATVAGVPAGAEDQINFVQAAGTIGDWVQFVADPDNSQWLVTGACSANGGITATDPS